jgi:hypothetical protein
MKTKYMNMVIFFAPSILATKNLQYHLFIQFFILFYLFLGKNFLVKKMLALSPDILYD